MRARGEYYGMVVRQMESHGEYAGGTMTEEVLR
jgi:hypothetical protein